MALFIDLIYDADNQGFLAGVAISAKSTPLQTEPAVSVDGTRLLGPSSSATNGTMLRDLFFFNWTWCKRKRNIHEQR